MKLLVIGATRGIGHNLLEQAIEEGHEVRALVRSLSRLNFQHHRITVIEGDILNQDAIERAVAGQDSVCVTIGIGPTWKPVSVFSRGTVSRQRKWDTWGLRAKREWKAILEGFMAIRKEC